METDHERRGKKGRGKLKTKEQKERGKHIQLWFEDPKFKNSQGAEVTCSRFNVAEENRGGSKPRRRHGKGAKDYLRRILTLGTPSEQSGGKILNFLPFKINGLGEGGNTSFVM